MAFKSTGKIKEIKDGVVIADGLSDVAYNELVEIQDSEGKIHLGLALNLDAESVGIIVLGEYSSIGEDDMVTATGKQLAIEVSNSLLSNVIDPLGRSLEDVKIVHTKDVRSEPLEQVAAGVSERKDVSRPLPTGIKSIDAMIPIGKGQRELIIGDRQTGKSAIAIDTIINQKGKNVKCIYVGIGQKMAKISALKARLLMEGAMDYTVIVAASTSQAASLQYIAPFTGVAIGEYFAKRGEDALVIFDDLTKHAWAYREISLLLKRPPGREAYPGDVFYLHSRLLERALQYSDENKGGSLTALPIIETQAGDISAYIPTNVISITDGQIYLESDLFNAGHRPAVNVGLSVSRVGGSAQLKAMKEVAGQLRLDLAQYRELAAFAQFGSDLDKETRAKLDRGARMQELLKQNQYDTMSAGEQVLVLYAGTQGYLDNIAVEDIKDWEYSFKIHIKKNFTELIEKIEKGESIKDSLLTEIEKALRSFKY